MRHVFQSRRGLIRIGRPLITGSLAVLIAVALSACSGSNSSSGAQASANQSNAGAQITIDDVAGPLTDSFFPPYKNGAEAAAAALHVNLRYLADDESDFATTSVNNMKIAIAQHPNAIVVGDYVPSASDPLIKQAIADGIPVYVDSSGQFSWQQDGALGFVGPNPAGIGVMAAQQMVKHGAKNLLCVINVSDNPYLEGICSSLATEIKSLGGTATNLDLPVADSTNPADVTQDIGAFLESHKSIDGIFSENAEVGTSSLAAAKSDGFANKIKIGTLELSQAALQDVKSGSMAFVISEQQYLEGFYSVLGVYEYVKYGLIPVGTVYTGPSLIDSSNIDKVLATSAKYPNVLGAS